MLFAICRKACDALRASRLPFPFESVFIKNVIVLSITQTPISVVSVPSEFYMLLGVVLAKGDF